MPATLRLILGDQLNRQHSWLQERQPEVGYVLMELRQETDYVRHHSQKVLGFFAAMRRFAAELRQQGHCVHYFTIDDPANTQTIAGNLRQLIAQAGYAQVAYQLPDEYRLDQQLRGLSAELGVPVAAVDTEHFLTQREELATMFAGKQSYRMETFYRHMRRRWGVMLEADGSPAGGRWNYDVENRKKLPEQAQVPAPLVFRHDLRELQATVEAAGIDTFGRASAAEFPWPLDRAEALQLLRYFCQALLPYFGTYQDAMHTTSWATYHARLSFALNTKMLGPKEVIDAVIAAWHERPAAITIAQVEGFVRQILGWREFMRGVYWAHMPEYASRNALGHKGPLPSWYWTGEVKMNCLHHVINQSLDYAYAHHIQRLMVAGNFAMLIGAHPDVVDEWYLGVYIDAIQWVELPNTRGMSQWADGGLVATKPYAASANYMHKMSNYCRHCPYDRKQKTGPNACPFNSLYWHFYHRHAEQLQDNPRIGMAYRQLQKMPPADKAQILAQAERHLEGLEEL
jgi:deoxyribodipyrimidine photolyase-related protein